MDADWSVACGADDPLVVIPWRNISGTVTYIDLRAFPAGIKDIPEAVQYPTLAVALQRWNQSDSPVFTAKCDVWVYPADLFDVEDLPGFAFAQGSYIDIIQRRSSLFDDFSAAEEQLRRWTQTARSFDLPDGRCEWSLRRAWIASAEEVPATSTDTHYHKGFATTLYVWGYGSSPQAASSAWTQALESFIEPVLCLS